MKRQGCCLAPDCGRSTWVADGLGLIPRLQIYNGRYLVFMIRYKCVIIHACACSYLYLHLWTHVVTDQANEKSRLDNDR